ncbi:peptide deformylase [Dokdonia sp. Hel_I_63]|jgi:peptide deformylase|uniref:peptide deformylase n=1 Tax=unclassified Dokdonia TaxID=2615033 RepID=UPI000D54445C|nr:MULTISPECIES: peptide deformylase [unclassified Dokdonia]AWH74673.1 peptide deformylase [Dokdonia sp. Dokd-P16]TVZ22539.1 peptide deformylase [Dokdonia sp. Hel_I_63]|tara:strand:+ start:152486 stop:153076 length:591 start_codon:yes stop_codon:yes gene_type:complete
MIIPIVAYGDPVLKKKAKDITPEYPKFSELIENMYDTMYEAHGVGLAAPQIGLPIRVFLVDTTPFAEDESYTPEEQEQLANFKKTFVNAEILEEEGEEWAFSEGCLSIPGINEDVFRKPKVTIRYQDENFKEYTETYDGLIARVIQHEYDHIEGVLFTDKLSSLKKRLIKGKLVNISKGKCNAEYRMRFPAASKKR